MLVGVSGRLLRLSSSLRDRRVLDREANGQSTRDPQNEKMCVMAWKRSRWVRSSDFWLGALALALALAQSFFWLLVADAQGLGVRRCHQRMCEAGVLSNGMTNGVTWKRVHGCCPPSAYAH